MTDVTRRQALIVAAASSGLGLAFSSRAAGTTEEAARLKGDLTPLGAERAANRDGTIPAWNGGIRQAPAGYRSGDPRPDPFAADRPLFTVDAKSLANHQARLSEGTAALLQKYPESMRLVVYPTRRSAAAPDAVYENTARNVTRARTAEGGLVVEGAYGGIPFPLPKTGAEVMWNFMLSWQGEAADVVFRSYMVTEDGRRVLGSASTNKLQFPYYYEGGSPDKFEGDYRVSTTLVTEPPSRSGEAYLVRQPLDMVRRNTQSWQYLPGQRRVRKAPNIGYDAPNFISSGVNNFDEIFLWSGSLDRYEWKLVGKQELLIPYNNNAFALKPVADVLGARHLNPDHVRWELHRVWVVEASLAPGKRNVVARRRYYLDEDTWQIVLGEGWDAQGKLWRHYQSLPTVYYDFPGVFAPTHTVVNLQTGAWLADSVFNELPYQYRKAARVPDTQFAPDALSNLTLR